MIPPTAELLLRWDAIRERSLQTEIGMSALGDCQRRTGYRVHGYQPDEGYERDGIQAVLGTAIHEIAAIAATTFVVDARAETLEVSFGGLLGHPDLYVDGTVRDIKTLGYTMQLENIRRTGPRRKDRWQAHCYGAGLILSGRPVHTVQIDYIARDSGDEYLHTEPFDVGVVREAMAWLQNVRNSDVTDLSRDFRPSSATCQSCEFFRRCWDSEPGHDPLSVLYREDPEAAAWAARLEDARARLKQAEADEEEAKGALDALRTISRPGEREYIRVPGLDKDIKFTMNKGKTIPNVPAIVEDYKRAGARPPMKTGEPTVSIALVKPKPEEA